MDIPEFAIPVRLSQLIVPSVCVGILFAGFASFLYIYLKTREKVYAAIFILSILAFVFTAGESLVIAFGAYLNNQELGRQVHRIEQLTGVLFIPAISFFILSLVEQSKRLERLHIWLTYIGIGFAVIVFVAAFVDPELFISQTVPRTGWDYEQSTYGRGAEGPLYMARDIALGVMILYLLFFLIREMIKSKRIGFLLPILVGLGIAIAAAANDISYSYTFVDFLFPGVQFPRFTTGITIFVLFSMATVLGKFIKQAQQVESAYAALHQSERRFTQIANNINEVFWLVDLYSRKLLYVSPAYANIWNRNTDALHQSLDSWVESIHPEDREETLKTIFSLEGAGERSIEYRILIHNGEIRWIRERIFPVADDTEGIARIARLSADITEKKAAEEELVFLAYHDPLTGLMNRKSFYERFESLILQAKRYKSENKRALLFIDLDNFKDINDSLGHDVGDELLCLITEKLQKTLRNSDQIFRIGGDEFTIVLSKIEEDTDAALVSKKILDSFAAPFKVSGRILYLGLSIGIAIYPKDGETVEMLIRNADTALYAAKKSKNSFQYYTEELQDTAFEKMRFSSLLKEAVLTGDFYMVFQPQVDCSGKLVGSEALVRWEHRELGTVSPGIFIPLAEETGQIIPLGAWVLDTVCRKIKSWAEQHNGVPVSVNLSVKQLAEKNIVSTIVDTMAKYNICPEQLHFEITESFLLENQDMIVEKLHDLAGRGLHFSIDDFGTGYSSLSYLKRLPIKMIKIDRSFITGVPGQRSDEALIEAIISLSKGLDLRVVAEGVETDEQLSFLQNIGCNIIQGYLFSKPLREEAYLLFVQQNRKNGELPG